MSDRLFGILGHQYLEFGFGALVLEEGLTRVAVNRRELCPRVRSAHVDYANGLNFWPRRLDAEQARGLAYLDASPELPLCRQKEMLVERVCRNGHLHPFAAAGDDREHCSACRGHPHIMLQLGHMNLASNTAPV